MKLRDYLKAIALIAVFFFFTSLVYADHNSHLQAYDANRGYTKENCLKKVSRTTKLLPHWLGHNIGCLIPEIDHYFLSEEYSFMFLKVDNGIDLILGYRKHGDELKVFDIIKEDVK